MSQLRPEPLQPPESSWHFVNELQRPLWQPFDWKARPARRGEVSLAGGVLVEPGFCDERGRLDTAYDDLNQFLAAAAIPLAGTYRIRTRCVPTAGREAYQVVVGKDQCEILAADTEGIRRGIFFLEDEIRRACGPFLSLGVTARQPVIRTRITRCFFGPIHRPPKNRDELTDDVNYYPDEYLNRLAHEGINGLWLTIHFAEICPQTVLPEYSRDPSVRLNKLRSTAERCARYGIKVYVFANEPIPIMADSPVGLAHPELLGQRMGWGNRHFFCTSNPTAQAYLEEAMRNLFSAIPDLGGLINISIGEGGSHCYSGAPRGISCPRCKDREPYDVLNDTLAAMERGMHAANPDAELVSWPYGQYWSWGDEMTVTSAGRLPKGVILQHNFESSAIGEQCGRKIRIFDYWLSFIGPSRLFADCAQAAVRSGNRMFAKLQVGCSHEVATAPFVPVPGHLFRKYKTMHELGVSGVMQCWYFGNYPGLMNQAAGELAFAPFPATEDAFLLGLARRDWGEDAPRVVRAWKLFQSGYSNFPLNHVFGWYGPMHDAPTWPLHLEPADRTISPSWELASYHTCKPFPASGDRIGECFGYTHTFAEICGLCRAMANDWNHGVAILKRLLPRYASNPERVRDIGVASALGIQFESGANMLEFYACREELPWQPPLEQRRSLARMRRLVKRELVLDAALLELAKADSRLGFHSEAEGYKYFPAKIEWRMEQLQGLLAEGFPRLARQIRLGEVLWPEYTGVRPEGRVQRCPRVSCGPAIDGDVAGPIWRDLPEAELEVKSGAAVPAARTFWKACMDQEALYVAVRCTRPATGEAMGTPLAESVRLLIEPRRLWPQQWYLLNADGTKACSEGYALQPTEWTAVTRREATGWSATVRIPLARLRAEIPAERPLRLDLERNASFPEGALLHSWVERHPFETSRLCYGTANSADFGWLIPE
jgi:hypothetical protein